MILKVNAEGLVAVPVVDNVGKLTADDTIILLPGWNEIKPDLWDKVEVHLQDYIKNNVFELKGKKIPPKDKDGVETIEQQLMSEIRADIAKDIVRGCFNLTNLKEWSQDPKLSTELRAVCDIQIQKCEKGEE